MRTCRPFPGARAGNRLLGQAGPDGGAGVVELALQGGVGPLEAAAAGDDEERDRHQPFQVAVGPVAGVLEGVQQDHGHHGFLGRDPGELPGEQVRVVRLGVDVRLGVQEVREQGAAGQGAYGLAAFAQRGGQGASELADGAADGPGSMSAWAALPSADWTCCGRVLAALAADLPSPILADVTGMHRHTALRWVAYARRDWAEYLAARAEDEANKREKKG
ncbi:hypothetical protein [Streptomyces sp. NPDC059970]|uniref:hypothetical protein n=1 Tax=Streptomyces sp. NPDC059970 TaxID=3347019 RepID=UPI0036B15419